MASTDSSEDTELLREIRDLLLEGVKLKRIQIKELVRDHKHAWPIGGDAHVPCVICGKPFDAPPLDEPPALRVPLGHEAEQAVHEKTPWCCHANEFADIHKAQQSARGARDNVVTSNTQKENHQDEKPYFCTRCQIRTYKPHNHLTP